MSKFEKIEQVIVEKLGVDSSESAKILEKALIGGEITDKMPAEQWLEERFLPNCVVIDEEGYSKMCIDALKILGTTAATDYGGSRQRDLGQLWADMTRGYLGELAFSLFFRNNRNVVSHFRKYLAQYEKINLSILIAGVALSNNLVLVTNNEDHFRNIEGLEILNWSKNEATSYETGGG